MAVGPDEHGSKLEFDAEEVETSEVDSEDTAAEVGRHEEGALVAPVGTCVEHLSQAD